MKKVKILLFGIIGLMTLSCSIGDENAKIISIYEGSWSGTYTGTKDNGDWELQVDKEGNITGITKSYVNEGISKVEGSVYSNGDLYVSSGTTSGGTVFIGEMSGNIVKGSWVNEVEDFSGEWTGNKLSK